MKGKKSRLALMGALALVMALTVGLLSGSVADAKKKKKKKSGATSVTISKTTPTAVPPSTGNPPTTPGTRSLVSFPLTVGKVAKGKVVSLDSFNVAYSLTGAARTATAPAAASQLRVSITSPQGREINVTNPGAGDQNATNIGPVNVTPDSPFGVCQITVTATETHCNNTTAIQDPESTVAPPTYSNAPIGSLALAGFGGMAAQGTWTVKVRNFSDAGNGNTVGTLSNITITFGLSPAPGTTTTSTGGKKK